MHTGTPLEYNCVSAPHLWHIAIGNLLSEGNVPMESSLGGRALLKIAHVWQAEAFLGRWRLIRVPCEKRARLLTFYRSTVSIYSASVNDLTLMRSMITLQEYSRLSAAVEKARMASETARLALDRHMEEHGC
jgi:hypothetical protein